MASILESITARIRELEDELGRLRAAKAALATGTTAPPRRASTKRQATARPQTTSGKQRAPRGLRIEQTRKLLSKNPQAKDAEIAAALGISRQQAQQLRKKVQT